MPVFDRSLVVPGAKLYTECMGIRRTAEVLASPYTGQLVFVLDTGLHYRSISALAIAALPPTANVQARNGWVFWSVEGEVRPRVKYARRRRGRATGTKAALVPGSAEFLQFLKS